MSFSNFNPNYLEPENDKKEINKKKKNRKNKKVKFSEEEEKNNKLLSNIDNDLETTNIKSNSFNDTENNVILESKFSLRNIFLKICLFSIFILIIYLAYLFIFKKKKFLELINNINPFRSKSLVTSNSISNSLSGQPFKDTDVSSEILSKPSSVLKESTGNSNLSSDNFGINNLSNNKLDLDQLSSVADTIPNSRASMIETQTIEPNLKGGQEYIDNNQLVSDIMAILKQAN